MRCDVKQFKREKLNSAPQISSISVSSNKVTPLKNLSQGYNGHFWTGIKQVQNKEVHNVQ